ncbi:hypothetical protein [Chenggangzhangella methanolivorans]|uniref:Uncharacterized protein n=1 Tax=Chenggangzhangella methanolivorans TaxID=1437009 RepID=A0A9E6R9J0_9HYPH|nr:hypothetical protein [Chenggangzhangella methanolivorans]QZO00698.1 hypothetical protein K6K41_03050 [Chenggangzhangella methanolivorans]
MAQLFRAGSTKSKIAKIFGVTENAIQRYLVKDGLLERSIRRDGKAEPGRDSAPALRLARGRVLGAAAGPKGLKSSVTYQ